MIEAKDMTTHIPQRGFTLLIAVILSSVALALGLALIDVAYKQVTLALASKQSQYAFVNADTALECALYWDQKQDAFNHEDAGSSFNINCGNQSVAVSYPSSSGVRTATFSIPCGTAGANPGTVAAAVTVRKESDARTSIYANGYSVCSPTDLRRIERGLKASY